MLCRTCISIMSRSRSDLEVNIQMLIFCVCYISPKPLIGFSWILCQMFTLSRQCTSTFQWFLHMPWIEGRFFMKLVVSISLFNTVCRTVMSDQGHGQSSNGKFLYPLHIFETTGRFFLQLGCSAKQDDIQNPTYQWCQIKIKVLLGGWVIFIVHSYYLWYWQSPAHLSFHFLIKVLHGNIYCSAQ